jgi:uncharacterized protein
LAFQIQAKPAVPATTREFQLFAKPVGACCNLACRYCYYLESEGSAAAAGPHTPLDDRLLGRDIVQHFEAAPGSVVAFSWHGGEPTLAGLDFFRRVVELQRGHCPPGRRFVNGIQTNGLLIDEAWCRFLAAERFRVGLSLDGPAAVHDAWRTARGGQPTHAAVVRALERLARHRVATDVLCVVHDLNVRQPVKLYRYFRSLGVRSLGLLPLVERVSARSEEVSSRSVGAEAYGTFLCVVFDEWFAKDRNRVAIQLFDEATRPARGLEHSLCIFRPTCGDVPVMERNGDVYACDHFVDEAHRIGNVAETALSELIDGEVQRAFGRAKWDSLPHVCRTCEVLLQCHGGCPKDRFIRAPDGEPGLNYLCAGLKRFFRHVEPYAERLAAEYPARITWDDALRLVDERAAGGLAVGSGTARGRERQNRASGTVPGAAGRNDPCPCGSGLKYKRCCLPRQSAG